MQASTSVLEALENISPQCPQPHSGGDRPRWAVLAHPAPGPYLKDPISSSPPLQTVPEGPRAGTELTAPWKEDLPAA